MFYRHAKRTTNDSSIIEPESPVGEVLAQIKGLSPAGLQSQAGTTRFAVTGTQFD